MSRGKDFARSVREEFDLNQSQSVLVQEIAAVLDVIDGLPASEVVETRQQRLLLARLTALLALPEIGEEESLTPAQKRAKKAAESRWQAKRSHRA